MSNIFYLATKRQKRDLRKGIEKIVYQVVIAQWLAWRLATRDVPGSNPVKGDFVLI